MKALCLKVSAAVFMLASVFAATPVLAGHVLDFQVLGRGSVDNDCSPLASAITCNIVLSGQASGTHIGHDDFNLNLRVTALGSRLSNGEVGGVCVVVHGSGTLVPPGPIANPPTISFNVAGTVCEEGGADSPAHFDGTYRITGGDNRFAGRSGGGSLTATYIRGAGGLVFLHLHGTIDR